MRSCLEVPVYKHSGPWRVSPACYRVAVFAALLAVLYFSVLPAAQAQAPTLKYERGIIFANPVNGEWNKLGVYVGRPGASQFSLLSPDAIKVAHGRLEKFMPADQNNNAYFPYNELAAYETAEVAAGRPPIFVTATYKGKARPVYFLPVQGTGTLPRDPLDRVPQAVNVRDERFIHFWIDRYARPILRASPANTWIGLDDCRFMVSMYGVLDDAGKYVPGVPWDRPFPQNDDEFLDGLKYFFKRLRELAPDIKVMCNIASLNDWRRFPEVYEDVPGIMNENLLIVQENPRDFTRLKAYRQMQWYQWFGAQKRVMVLRSLMPVFNADHVQAALMLYLLVRNSESYFVLQIRDTATNVTEEIPPPAYIGAKVALGDPIEPMQHRKEPGAPNEGFRLYWRKCVRGIVYVNYTGKRQTVSLPSDKVYYDRDGNPVTQLLLEDLATDYVLTRKP